ncbi:MAG: TonB-dependent receptor [Dokdonella sp.]
MTLISSELCKAVRYALYASATAVVGLSALPAIAQTSSGEQTDQLETVVVTGSRIRRVDLETASPVFSIDAASIAKSGKLTLGDLIQESPSIAGAATNPSVNNGGGTGASTVSIRGLGSQRTLLLVNGRRLAYADVNSIPLNMVERVDILKDGASAIYGSDAVAGVVNFVLKSNYQGIEATADYGISDRDDGERKGFQMTIGQSSDRGSIIIGASYNKQDAVSAGDREFSDPALYNSYGYVIALGSGSVPNGRFVIPRTVAQSFGINCAGTGANVQVFRDNGVGGTRGSDYRCYRGLGNNPNDTYNYSPFNLELTPQERGGLFVTGNYKLTDNVEAYIDAFTNKTRSRSIIAPLPMIIGQGGLVLSGRSIYNPFGVDIGAGGGGIRDISGGNRQSLYNTQADQIALGLKGTFGDTWSWDAGILAARTTQSSESTGYYNLSKLIPAVGPSFRDANGVARCGTAASPIANCTPINLFSLNNSGLAGEAANQAALRALQLSVKTDSYSTQKGGMFNLTGEVFNLPAGAVSLAVGGEYRKDYSNFKPDATSLITDPANPACGTFQDACSSASTGELAVREFYAELFVPILADVPFAKSLNLSLGSRSSDYTAFGSTINSKIGIEWRPIDDLLLRGTVAEVFRSPTISDLFSGVTPNAATYRDPCSGAGFQAGNPACAGTTPGFLQTTQQTNTSEGSNDQLQPEKGKSFTYGIVYDPSWLPGLSTSIDLWKIYLTGTIGGLGTQTIIDQCYNFGRFCNLFTRSPLGDIDAVNNRQQNIGRTDVEGADFGIKYRLPETRFGNFRVGLDATYFKKYNDQIITGDITTQSNYAGSYFGSASGGPGNLNRLRGLGTIAWSMGNIDASWRMRYIHNARFGSIVPSGDGYSIIDPTGDEANNSYRIGASTFHNMQVGYNIEPINTRVEFGIDNVFDKQPPLLYQFGFNGNTDERTYDTVGRYYWGRIGVKF